ncbi:MAG: PilZ domain-containing protein [Acidobacteriota bacterium]|nr:PilZ domain-containing protein [Acidobacteriota bacterium]
MSEASATPQALAAPQVGERRRIDRRKHPRYPVNGGGAELRQQGVDARIWARLTDISLGGCYLEIMSPLPVLTYVNLVLTLEEQRLQAKGQVVVSHPNFGMGIQYIELGFADRRILESWIAMLAAKAAPPAGRRLGEDPARTLDKEAAALLVHSIAEFYRVKTVMSREEFMQLVEERRKASKDGDGKSEALKP